MSNFDGSIKFDAKLDTSKLKKSLNEIGETGGESLKKLDKPAKNASKSIDKVGKSTEESAKDVQKFGKTGEKSLKQLDKSAKTSSKNIDEVGKSANDSAKDVKKLNKEADKSSKSLEKVNTASQSTSKGFSLAKVAAKGLATGGFLALLKGGTELVKKLGEIERETREYREDIGKLQTGFQTAGFSADAATKVYKDFYSFIGEEDRSVEAVNHLAKLCDNEKELSTWTKICTGVWGTFGDSLPIEGLTEAANETAKTGKVTGVLADALNWGSLAGETFGVKMRENTKANAEWNKSVEDAASAEDYFNLALEQCSNAQERQQLITSALNEGYSEAAEKYRKLNGDIIAANKAQSDWTDTMARIGEIVAPISGTIEQFGADALNKILDIVAGTDHMSEKLTEAGDAYETALNKATLTKDYITEWQNLQKIINDSATPSEELAKAQERSKAVEEWFIKNYSSYITAEEEKNGIREQSIKTIEKAAEAEENYSRWNFLNKLEENREKVIKLDKDLSNLKGMEDYWKKQSENSANIVSGLVDIDAEYKNLMLNANNLSDSEFNAELQRIAQSVSDLTGDEFGVASLPKLGSMIENFREEYSRAGEELDNTQKKIADNEAELGKYISQAELFIRTDLGGSYAEVSEQLDLMKQAQQELNEKGSITKETLEKLTEKIPEFKDHADDPQFLAEKIGEIETKLKDAETQLDNFGLKCDNFNKTITVKVDYKTTPTSFVGPVLPANANGTISAKKGLSVINERGTELIESADGSFRYVDSNGAALTYLDERDKVYTADKTQRMFGNIKQIRGFANGKSGNIHSGNTPFRINGNISADFETAGESISQNIADGIENNAKAVEKSTEKAYKKALSATERYNKRQAEINARQAAEDEEERRKNYEEKLKNAKDNEEKEKLIAEEEKRLLEKAEKEELETLKKAAEDEEKLRDKEFSKLSDDYADGVITQSQYYSELADLRDKYYDTSSEEYEKYSQEIMRGLREKEFDDLKEALDNGYIAESDYYKSLKELRDKYFAQGSKQWIEYSNEIIQHQKSLITELYSESAEAASSSFENVIAKKGQIQSVMSDFSLTDSFTINGMGTFTDITNLDDIITSNEAYINELKSFKTRLKNGGASDEIIKSLTGEIAQMSKKDAREFMRVFSGKSDDYVAKYVRDYKTIAEQSEYLSGTVLKDEIEQAKNVCMNEIDKLVSEFRKKGLDIEGDFENIGEEAGRRFGAKFKSELDESLSGVRDELNALSSVYIPANTPFSKYGGQGTVKTDSDYKSKVEQSEAVSNLTKGIVKNEFDKIVSAFEEKGLKISEDFENIGEEAGQGFGEKFKGELDKIFIDVHEKLIALSSVYIPIDTSFSKYGGNGTVTTNNSYAYTYNLPAASGETRREQLRAIEDLDTMRRQRGGY